MADTFWIRIKALGACSTRQVQQYAVLSYKPSAESKVELSYPLRTFPAYTEELNAVVNVKDHFFKKGFFFEIFFIFFFANSL